MTIQIIMPFTNAARDCHRKAEKVVTLHQIWLSVRVLYVECTAKQTCVMWNKTAPQSVKI
jgi:hypothetical protein